MLAAVYDRTGGPEVLRYAEVPDPLLHLRGVLIDVQAIGVQGGDLINRSRGAMTATPHIVGYQSAGTVHAVGADVTGFVVGQPVVAITRSGSHAAVVSAAADSVYAVPDGLDIELAAAVPLEFGTAHEGLFEFGRLRPGESVLVQAGAGGVGLAAIQLAKAAGAGLVLATASSDARLGRLHEYGMDHGIDYTTSDVPSEVMRLTNGRGVDLVVDPVGGRTLEGSIAALAYRGRISWVGRAGRDDRPPDVWPMQRKHASLTGVLLGVDADGNRARVRGVIDSVLRRAANGELRPVIDRRFPLSEAAAAHRYIEERQAFGRVLLIP
ncbi:MAG: zinc-binding alcohol dehydrogenase family protein [Ilumatobacteraceae bacterium]